MYDERDVSRKNDQWRKSWSDRSIDCLFDCSFCLFVWLFGYMFDCFCEWLIVIWWINRLYQSKPMMSIGTMHNEIQTRWNTFMKVQNVTMIVWLLLIRLYRMRWIRLDHLYRMNRYVQRYVYDVYMMFIWMRIGMMEWTKKWRFRKWLTFLSAQWRLLISPVAAIVVSQWRPETRWKIKLGVSIFLYSLY